MADKQNNNTQPTETRAGRPQSIWDNDLPPGDSPAMPRWPLTAAIIAYSCWMLFLVSMVVVRLKTA